MVGLGYPKIPDINNRTAAPNYTAACIVMFGVNLMWILMVIWAIWGFLAAAFTGWSVSHMIKRINVVRN